MKRILACILVLLLLCACGKSASPQYTKGMLTNGETIDDIGEVDWDTQVIRSVTSYGANGSSGTYALNFVQLTDGRWVAWKDSLYVVSTDVSNTLSMGNYWLSAYVK